MCNRNQQCPLCQSDQQSVLLSDGTRRLKRCRSCDVRYLDPLPSGEHVVDYFSDTYITSDAALAVSFSSNRQRVLSRVARYIRRKKASGRVLDIGCAGGFFLERFFGGTEWETWGVELSKFAAARATAKGINVHVGDMHNAGFPPGSFDIVTILDTLYYFPDPCLELRETRRVLKPDGLLVLELPLAGSQLWRNEAWIARAVGIRHRSLLRGDHLFFYTPRAVGSVLEKCEFKITDVVPLPGNRQRETWLDILYRSYFGFSWLLWSFSVGTVMLGPRFLVFATPG
jgi:SAM-dependent methyltransferase